MRFALPTLCLIAALAAPAQAAVPAAVATARAHVAAAQKQRAMAVYPDALVEQAKACRAAGLLKEAHDAAEKAAGAYDAQLEMHHELSEALPDAPRGRGERAVARTLGLARDRARFLAAQIAEQSGDPGLAVPDYVLVARSQPEEALGMDAIAALKALGWLSSPMPTTDGKATP